MNPKTLSKYLCKILRHEPESVGLTLKEGGWVYTDSLVKVIQGLNHEILNQIVQDDDKQRYSFNKDKSLIRCNWGHSVEIDTELEPLDPPDVLYHGTKDQFMPSINREDLKGMERNYVHLTTSIEEAMKVANRRKGKSVVLKINSVDMWKHGYEFYSAENGFIWLTKIVPPQYIEGIA